MNAPKVKKDDLTMMSQLNQLKQYEKTKPMDSETNQYIQKLVDENNLDLQVHQGLKLVYYRVLNARLVNAVCPVYLSLIHI